MSKTLEDIRRKIDTLDNTIHDLLMERAELVLQIGEEKRRNNIQIIQPAREAVMIRRLLGRHRGKLPASAVVRIWRELVGAVSLLQTGLKVAVAAPEGKTGYWDMARDYFGSVLPMQKVSNAMAAVAMVREDEANFAVVPWPEDGDANPWWLYLMDEGPRAMRIVVRLPYGDTPGEMPDQGAMALAVARITFDPTGDDHSFLALKLKQGVSRGRIVDVAKDAGLKPLGLQSRRNAQQSQFSFHLLEVGDYVAQDDSRMKKMLDVLEEGGGVCICVGGYPTPPVYARN